jgi:CTP synthase
MSASRLNRPVKFVIVTGGTVSGLGKGTAISSLGVVLQSFDCDVTCVKIDPYLNTDAGTMSPFEHGEVFVTADGAECDLDIGNYERFLGVRLTARNNLTGGKIFSQVISREREGKYLGKTVQLVPHVTDAVQDWIIGVADEFAASEDFSKNGCVSPRKTPNKTSPIKKPLICLVELGGTVGDIESALYLEAIQQLQSRLEGVVDTFDHTDDANEQGMSSRTVLHIHCGLVPVMGVVGEQKTKPCQHSVKLLREAGIKPDLLFCRSELPLEAAVRDKLAVFCQVPKSCVVSLHDCANIYRVPLLLDEQKVGQKVLSILGLKNLVATYSGTPAAVTSRVRLVAWKEMAERTDFAEMRPVSIAIVGKYTGLTDSYISVLNALRHATLEAGLKLSVHWVDATALEKENTKEREEADALLHKVDGVLVPGGFGDRGVEGKIKAASFCRTQNKPYFGICLGMQTAVIEYARSVLGLVGANSEEFLGKSSPVGSVVGAAAEKAEPANVVMFMPEGSTTVMGGTMRLGERICKIQEGSLACKLYGGADEVAERHRHRYEVNPDFVAEFEKQGLVFSGVDEKGERMEIVEIPENKFFIAAQFHPEFTSLPRTPNPLFLGFVLASAGLLEQRLAADGGVLLVGSGWTRPVPK